MICDLCRREFDPASCGASCSKCGTQSACEGARCPYCFYQAIPEVDWVQKIFPDKKKSPDPAKEQTRPLRLFEEQELGEITAVDQSNKKRLQRLLAIGALPGTLFKLVKTFPSYILEMGYSRFTIDEELAEAITARAIEE